MKIFSFTKAKVHYNILNFGSKSSYLRLNGRETAIRRSKPLLLFTYVMSLICDFSDFGEGIVSYLTR